MGFHWFAIMFSLERCFRGSDKKTHVNVCVCVCLGFCFLNTPPPSTPPPVITLTFPLPVKLLRSTLVLLFPSSFPPSLPLLLLPVTIYVWRRLQSLLFLSSPSLSPLCHTIPQSLPLPLLYSCPPPDTPSPSALLHV